MSDTSNQADLNRRSEMGRRAKRGPKKQKNPANTWWGKSAVVARIRVSAENSRDALVCELLDTARAVKVRLLGRGAFIVVNETTKPCLQDCKFVANGRIFVVDDPAIAGVLAVHEFRFNFPAKTPVNGTC